VEFEPVLNWIINGNGFIVYGGTKYIKELSKATRYLSLFTKLRSLNKVIKFPADKIDERQKEIMALENDEDFDDPHLPAIASVTRCKLICTVDSRAFKFIARKEFYSGMKPPKIYSRKANKALLCDRNIDKRLKEYIKKLNKEDAESFENILK
jgi:hypothetical protein